MANRTRELILLGLARALEAGTGTFFGRLREQRRYENQQKLLDQRMDEQRKQFQERMEATESRFTRGQEQINERLDRRLNAQEQARIAKEQAKTAPRSYEDFLKALGTHGAKGAMQDLLGERTWEGIGPPAPGMDKPRFPGGLDAPPEKLQEMLDHFIQQNPTEIPPELSQEQEFTRLLKEGVPGLQASQAAEDLIRKREREIGEAKRRRGDVERVRVELRERIRRMQGQQQPQGQGGDGGAMGYVEPRFPPLNPDSFSRLPQGQNVGLDDRMQLGMIAKHFNTIAELQPGGATPMETAEAWQWLAENLPIGQVPLEVELFAQGVPGTPTTRGMPTVRQLLG